MLDALILAAGALLVLTTFSDVFQSVIVPRPARRRMRVSANISRYGWRAWSWVGHTAVGNDERENFLGTFAPLLLIVLLAYWVASLIIGYGLIFYALRGGLRPVPDLGGAVYFAGTSLLTIGFGDIFAAVGGEWPSTGDKVTDAMQLRARADAIVAMNETTVASLIKKLRKA